MKKLSVLIISPLLLAGLFAFPDPATAQTTQSWDPTLTASSSGGGAGTWSSAANWFDGTSDTLWTNDNFAVFGGYGGVVTLGANQNVSGLTFSADGYVLNGSSSLITLTLDGTTPTIALPYGGTASINTIVAGSAGLTESGYGTLILGKTNTYTGGTAVGSGSTLKLNGVGPILGTIALGGGSPGGNLIVTNRVANAVMINPITGDSTTVVSVTTPGFNTYISGNLSGFYGQIVLNTLGGNLIGVNTAAGASMPSSAVGWNVPANAEMYIAGGVTIAAPITINGPGPSGYGAIRLDNGTVAGPVYLNGYGNNNQIGGAGGGVVTISGVISDNGAGNGLSRWGGGSTPVGSVLALSGQNTYSGPTTLSYGLLRLASAENPGIGGPLGSNALATIYFSAQSNGKWDGGALQYSSVNQYDYSSRFSTDPNQKHKIDVNGQSVTFASPLTSSGGTFLLFDTAGGGTLTFNAANTYDGGTTISNGTLVANAAGAIPAGPVTVGGGALKANAAGAVPGSVTVNNSGALIATASGSVLGNITVSSTAGTLTIGSPSALSSSAVLTLPASPAAGSVNLSFTGTQTIGPMYFGGIVQATGTWGAPGSAAVNQSPIFTGTGLLSVVAPVVATAYWDPSARKASPGSGGTGTWNSTLANWWQNGSSDTTWPPGDVATFAGAAGTVTLGASETAPGLAFNTSGYTLTNSSGAVLILAGTPTVSVAGGSATVACPIDGTAGLTKTAAGTLVLRGTNTYTGPTAVYGTLTIGGAGQLGSGNYLDNIADEGTFIYNSSATQTLAGVISDSGLGGTVLQQGPGPLTLSGASSYSGGTTVANGCALQINDVAGAGSGTLALGTNSVLIISNRVSNAAVANTITGDSTSVINMMVSGYNTYLGGSLAGFNGTIICSNITGINFVGVNTAPPLAMPSTAGGWIVAAGAELYLGIGSGVEAAPITINGPGPVGYGAIRLDSGNIAGNVLLNGSGTNNQIGGAFAGNVTISGVISDGGHNNGLNIWGAASTPANKVFVLSGQNTYGGPTTLSYGETQVASAENPGINGPLGRSNALSTIYFSAQPNAGDNGGALQYSGANHYDYSSRFSSDPGQKYKIDVNGQSVTFASPLTGSGGTFLLFDSLGGGILTLNATNTYGGGTTIAGGTLDVSSGTIMGAVTVNGGTLQLDSRYSLSPGTALSLASGVTVNLNYAGTQRITALFVDGTEQPLGVYGAGANNPNGIFTGSGTLTLTGKSPATLSSASIDGNQQLAIAWASAPGATYNVYSTTDLTEPILWTLVNSSPIFATGTTTSYTLPGSTDGQPQLFVRVGQ